ncbi:MAG: nucleotidyltransferase domain-containing protein [Planctomycetota bacterium]
MTESETTQPAGLGIDSAVDQVCGIIHERLRQVERERNLRVIFACESGSRAWGFASNDSDFDVRFIYVRPAADYLRLRPPVDAFDQQGEDDFDLAGWDIRKTCELMRKSNGPLFEWLDSPIIYEQDGDLSARLIALRADYFDAKKSVFHYLSLAGGVWEKYIADEPTPVRKKYLYTLRPLACVKYIAQHKEHPPTAFDAVLDRIDLPAETRKAIDALVLDKKANRELGAGPADQVLNQWITQVLSEGEAIANALPTSGTDNALLDQLIANAILAPKDAP